MEKKDLEELKNAYNEAVKLKNEKLKCLRYRDVKDYMDVMLTNNIPLDEDIMQDILRKLRIENDNNIYIARGLYFIKEMYNYFERCWLIKNSDIKYVKDLINRKIILNGEVSEIGYHLDSGKKVYGYPNDSVIITLPSLQKRINELEPFNYGNRNLDKEEINININILRAQYFIKMVSDGEHETISYYSNKKNYEEIEKKMKNYEFRKETNRKLLLRNSQK